MSLIGQVGSFLDKGAEALGINDGEGFISSEVETEMKADPGVIGAVQSFISGTGEGETAKLAALKSADGSADPAADVAVEEPTFFEKVGTFFEGLLKPTGDGVQNPNGETVKGENIFSQIGNLFTGNGGNPGGVLGNVAGALKGIGTFIYDKTPIGGLLEKTGISKLATDAAGGISEFFTNTEIGKDIANIADFTFGENSILGKGADFLNTPVGFGLAVVGAVILGPLLMAAVVPAAATGGAAALMLGGGAAAVGGVAAAGGVAAVGGTAVVGGSALAAALPYMLGAGAGVAILGGNVVDWVKGLIGGKTPEAGPKPEEVAGQTPETLTDTVTDTIDWTSDTKAMSTNGDGQSMEDIANQWFLDNAESKQGSKNLNKRTAKPA